MLFQIGKSGDTVKITQKEARKLLSPVRTNEMIYTFSECYYKDVLTNDCRGWIKFPEENVADITFADRGTQNEGTMQNPSYLLNLEKKRLTLIGEWKPKYYSSNQKVPLVLEYELSENLEPVALHITITTGKRKLITNIEIASKESRAVIKDFIKTTPDYQSGGFVFIESEQTDSVTLAKKKMEEEKQAYLDSLNYVRKKAEEDRIIKKRIADSIDLVKQKQADSTKLAKQRTADSLRLATDLQKQRTADSLNNVKKQQADSIKLVNQRKADSIQLAKEQQKRTADSLNNVKRQQADSIRLANQRTADSIKIATDRQKQRTADSLNNVKKQQADSIKLANQRTSDSIQLAKEQQQRTADSIKIATDRQKQRTADSLNNVKRQQADSIKLANQRTADSIQLAKEQQKRTADSLNNVKKQQADSIKLANQRKADSIRLAKEQQQRTADSLKIANKKYEDSVRLSKQRIADSIARIQKNKKTNLQIIRSENITDIDGFQYKTVRMGTQTWMAENLNVTRFRNGDPIMEAQTMDEWREADMAGIPAWCYFNGDAENAPVFGKLYNWYAIRDPRGLAPAKWHIPNLEEWTRMFTFIGGNQKAGTILKDTTGWHEKGNGTNLTGFSARPSGSRDFSSNFKGIQRFGYWWINEEHGAETAWGIDMGFSYGNINIFAFRKGNGFAIRCVRD